MTRKRHHADPRLLLIEVELEPFRDQCPESVGGRAPVGEQQVLQGLAQ